MRKIVGKLIGLVLRITGCSFRFSKNYRWQTTRYHTTVYFMVDTIAANYAAEGTAKTHSTISLLR